MKRPLPTVVVAQLVAAAHLLGLVLVPLVLVAPPSRPAAPQRPVIRAQLVPVGASVASVASAMPVEPAAPSRTERAARRPRATPPQPAASPRLATSVRSTKPLLPPPATPLESPPQRPVEVGIPPLASTRVVGMTAVQTAHPLASPRADNASARAAPDTVVPTVSPVDTAAKPVDARAPGAVTASTAERPPVTVAAPGSRAAPLDVGIEYLRAPEPGYPPLARQRGEQGRVVVLVRIDARGQPSDVAVHASSGSPRLDRAALDAAADALFRPFVEAGLPVSKWALVPIVFSLLP